MHFDDHHPAATGAEVELERDFGAILQNVGI
jgi:hypothetical protein